MVDIGTITPAYDDGIGTRARIGLVSLATDHTVEAEFRTLLSAPGVAFFTTRVANDPTINIASLRAMKPRLTDAAATLLPGVPFDVIAYACTSASLMIGHDGVAEAIRAAHPEAEAATTMNAVADALRRRGARRIAMVTPYIGEINEAMAAHLGEVGFEIARAASFNEPDDNRVARLSAAAIFAAARDLGGAPDIDAIFVSCTNIRTVDHIAEWERALGKPVVSSNIALAEKCLELAGIEVAPVSDQVLT